MPRPASISGGPTRSRPRASRAPKPGKAIPQLTGGGSSWVTGTYDPELDLVYWGIGNPAPWNPRARKGDNLFTNSIFAIRPKTGERVWYFQTTPEDPFDYDAVQTPIIATINVGGSPRKVVMQANRSGFLYVLDAKDGKLIAGQRLRQGQLGERHRHEDRTSEGDRRLQGRARRQERHGVAVGVGRDQLAAHVVQPEDRHALHQHAACRHDLRGRRAAEAGARDAVRRPAPSSAPTVTDDPNVRGFLKAVDPLTGKSKWETPYKSPNYSSTMVTASNLVFTGVMTGEFQALDADTGKILWSFQTPSGIVGQPITWEKDGKQYVTVMSGIGGVYAQRAGDPNLENAADRRVAVDVRAVRQVT